MANNNGRRIIVNAECDEVRVAILEKNILSEFYVERKEDQRYVGNIYKGRVDSVVPGIQSAFVDIGLEKNGFLYVTDVLVPGDQEQEIDFDSDFDLEAYKKDKRRLRLPIEQMLSPGDEVIVQVEKDPISSKGVRLTNFVSLPGRFTVLMPLVRHRGISKRIAEYEERDRLREIVSNIKFLKNYGCVVRTAAQGRDKRQVVADFRYLTKCWNNVLRGERKREAPALLHEESNLIMRTVRDHFIDNVEEFVVDNKEEFKKVKSFLGSIMPEARKKVVFYKHEEPIFEYYGLEKEVKKIFAKTVSLRCGGYLVIEETEALVAIDVNTGRNIGRGDFEKTVCKTNLEAAVEIPRQLRLRDIGGIVIIDFIDMKIRKNQQEVWNTLLRETRKDKSKINISHISKMGLVEMTRQRKGSGIFNMLHDKCPCCDGRGLVKSPLSSALDVMRQIKLVFLRTKEKAITLYVHSEVADKLLDNYRDHLMKLEKRFHKQLDVRRDREMLIDQYSFVASSTKEEIEILS